jgi:hypothetical protein
MYALIRENGHVVWKEWWYAFTSKVSLQADLYMTCEDHVFIVDVVVIDLMWEMVAFSVINQLVGVAMKLNATTKINIENFMKGHHFILMAMEVHGEPGCDMGHFIKECVRLFHDKRLRGHLSLSICIQFFKWHVRIVFQNVLAFAIERKITLTSDACSRPPIIIRSHDLHIGDIKEAAGEITSYHERD